MKIIIYLILLFATSSLILEADYSAVSNDEDDSFSFGAQSRLYKVSFKGKPLVSKKRWLDDRSSIDETSILLEVTRLNLPNNSYLRFFSLRKKQVFIGLDRYLSDGKFIEQRSNMTDNEGNERLNMVTEQTITDVFRGMANLHKAGIIHNDFHEENFLIDDFKRAVVCDYGKSKMFKPIVWPETIKGLFTVTSNTLRQKEFVDGVINDTNRLISVLYMIHGYLKAKKVNFLFDWDNIIGQLDVLMKERKTIVWIFDRLNEFKFN